MRESQAAGTTTRVYALTNESKRLCSLRGYPGVSFADANGKHLPDAVHRQSRSAGHLVALAPNAAAYFSVANAGNVGQRNAECISWTYVAIIPPNDRARLLVKAPGQGCETFTVTPVRRSP